jgi:hypothetical protein
MKTQQNATKYTVLPHAGSSPRSKKKQNIKKLQQSATKTTGN